MDPLGVRWETRGLEVLLDVSTQVLEQPELKDADTGPEMFHYVRKEKIAESAVMGTFVMALCGETFPVTKAAKPGSPVCPQCKEIYESMSD
jgi:formylmethanofuran dehydrogenase subunit E